MRKKLLFFSLVLTLSLVCNKNTLKIHAQNIDNSYFSNLTEYIPLNTLSDVVSFSSENINGYFIFGDERVSVQISTITTPNRTNVEVYKVLDDISDSLISYLDSIVDLQYPNVTRLGNATAKYNCHSYAWYSQNGSNTYWMNNPSPYYTDNSYLEVTTPMQGDIICYFDDNGTPNNYADDTNLHSGIVVEYDPSILSNGICSNSNQVIVKSKWGVSGLYQHKGDDCPYTTLHNGTADYVKYYRRHYHNYEDHYCTMCNQYTETHDYHDPYTWVNFSKHDATCGCEATTQQGHAISSSGGSLLGSGTRYKTCLLCGGSAEIGFVQLNATSTEIEYVTEKGSYILPNGVIVLVDEDIEAYMNHTILFQKKNNSLTTE